ncbi:MAG: Crp/Fnr family transcriptional regulator [Thermodesulfovibrionales bacterium]
MKCLSKQHYSRGEMIYQQGDSVTTLFIVEMGRVEIYKTDAEGNRLTLWFIDPGELFCVPSVLFEMALANAEAVKDSVVYCLEKNDFERLVQRYPELSLGLLHCLSGRIMSYSDSLETIAFSNAKARIAKILLKYSILDDKMGKILQLSQNEIASLVGTSRETVCRVLNQFKREKLITIRNRKIIILDDRKLKVECEPFKGSGRGFLSPL